MKIKEAKKYILENNLGKIDEEKSFSDITTLKVGGKIRLIFYPETIEKFIIFYHFLIKIEIDYVVVGLGSNILASDNFYNGIVVSFKKLKIDYYKLGDSFYLYPQCKMSKFSKRLMNEGYSGIEYFAGIPGTIGGVVTMNAGCFGKSISDYLVEVVALNSNGELKRYKKEELEFDYRSSRIKEKNEIILLVKLRFSKISNINEIKTNYLMIQKMRKNNQPINELSAGCAFKNPKTIKAWEVVKKLGYSDARYGGAMVSEKHNNFIINTGNANASDLYKLLKIIQRDAKEKLNLELENEWILINFD